MHIATETEGFGLSKKLLVANSYFTTMVKEPQSIVSLMDVLILSVRSSQLDRTPRGSRK